MRSFWENDSFYARADVAIIGAGLLGLWTARELKMRNPKLKVTLIDAGATPTGASTRNAGFACFGSPSELLHDAALNEAAMWRNVAMRFDGIQKIQSVMGNHIDYDPCGGYECYNHGVRSAPSQQQLNWLNDGLKHVTGIDETFQFSPEKLAQFGLSGFTQCVSNQLEGGIHPGKLVQGLLQTVTGLGVNTLFGTAITNSKSVENGWQLFENERLVLESTQVLYAVNGFSGRQFPELGIVPARGQVLLTPPLPGLQLRGTFHFEEGFYYWRNLGNRILLGGARHLFLAQEESTELQPTENVQAALFEFLLRHFPQAAHLSVADCRWWAGIMGLSARKQPQMVATAPGRWLAMCCNGMGVALAPIWAEKVADAILG